MEATPNLSAVHSHSKAVHSRSEEARREALTRAVSGQTMSNYPAIFQGFIAKGIPESEIRPRENVFTFNAWRALGRTVRTRRAWRQSAHVHRTRQQGNRQGHGRTQNDSPRPWTTTVFHVSQTEAIKGGWAMTTPTFDFPVRLSEKYRPRRIAEFVGLLTVRSELRVKFVARPYDCSFLFLRPAGGRKDRPRASDGRGDECGVSSHWLTEMHAGGIGRGVPHLRVRPTEGTDSISF